MPIVTRADCSKLELRGNFTFRHSALMDRTSMFEVVGDVTLSTVECHGAGKTNDLSTYYQTLFSEGKVNEAQKSLFGETLVGNGNCGAAIQSRVNALFNVATKPTAKPAVRTTSEVSWLSFIKKRLVLSIDNCPFLSAAFCSIW